MNCYFLIFICYFLYLCYVFPLTFLIFFSLPLTVFGPAYFEPKEENVEVDADLLN